MRTSGWSHLTDRTSKGSWVRRAHGYLKATFISMRLPDACTFLHVIKYFLLTENDFYYNCENKSTTRKTRFRARSTKHQPLNLHSLPDTPLSNFMMISQNTKTLFHGFLTVVVLLPRSAQKIVNILQM